MPLAAKRRPGQVQDVSLSPLDSLAFRLCRALDNGVQWSNTRGALSVERSACKGSVPCQTNR